MRVGHDELVLRHRYEALSIVNDVLIAGWFATGSILFFQESTTRLGTWMFLIGSIQLGIRPLIRLSRLLHIRRRGSGLDSSTDF
ncbi:MAG: YrhK family protein [Actinomycetes bacterium]